MEKIKQKEHDAWKKYKKWQKENKDKIREGQEIHSLGEFQEIYRQAGRRITVIKDEVQFLVRKKTFKAFEEQYEKATGEKLNKTYKGHKSLRRTKNTQELAEMLLNEIKDYREAKLDEAKAQGLSEDEAKKKANLAVSAYFFGS